MFKDWNICDAINKIFDIVSRSFDEAGDNNNENNTFRKGSNNGNDNNQASEVPTTIAVATATLPAKSLSSNLKGKLVSNKKEIDMGDMGDKNVGQWGTQIMDNPGLGGSGLVR